MNANPFELVPEDVNILVAQVVRAAREECEPESCLISPVLEACAAQAVSRYWRSPIKTFVPLLALREVRECIRLGACPEPGSELRH